MTQTKVGLQRTYQSTNTAHKSFRHIIWVTSNIKFIIQVQLSLQKQWIFMLALLIIKSESKDFHVMIDHNMVPGAVIHLLVSQTKFNFPYTIANVVRETN